MMTEMTSDEPIEAVELERVADWRLRQLGANPDDRQSAAAATLLQRLADDVRQLRGGPLHTEYLAILNWLGEFDVIDDFAERANDYRARIGIEYFPQSGEDYLRALIALAREAAGA
jgi:hypothetical protein